MLSRFVITFLPRSKGLPSESNRYTFFSSVHRTFSRVDHIFGHKSNLDKFKEIRIISNIFSDHNAKRLGINYGGKSCKKKKKNPNTWRLNNMLLNNQLITEEINKEILKKT